jgi:DNA transformation protein
LTAVSVEANEFVSHVLDLLEPLGPVSARRMFGGYGIYVDRVMFALVADDVLYLKVDDVSRAEFEAAGLGPFCYSKQGKSYRMSYHAAPEAALEDAQLLRDWARKAVDAAFRTARGKRK